MFVSNFVDSLYWNEKSDLAVRKNMKHISCWRWHSEEYILSIIYYIVCPVLARISQFMRSSYIKIIPPLPFVPLSKGKVSRSTKKEKKFIGLWINSNNLAFLCAKQIRIHTKIREQKKKKNLFFLSFLGLFWFCSLMVSFFLCMRLE